MTTAWTTVALAPIGGAALWTFAEYAMHNWRGHLGRGRNEFSREHLRHHADTAYFTPASKKARLAAPISIVVAIALVGLLGPLVGVAASVGFLGAYIGYELAHRRAHVRPPRGPYSRWLRRHHFHHHFMDPRTNHGVTSPIWDIAFGTYARPGVVRVPERQAMDWLVDPATGEARPEFAADYRVVRAAPRDPATGRAIPRAQPGPERPARRGGATLAARPVG